MEANEHISIFSFDFLKLIFKYLQSEGTLWIFCIVGIFILFIFLSVFINSVKNIRNIASEIKETNNSKNQYENKEININPKNVFKNLKPEYKKHLLLQGVLLSLPISIGFLLPLIAMLFVIPEVISGHNELTNLLGLLVMIIAIYVLSNHIQHWFFHQLITNKCTITMDTVIYIKEKIDESTYIKVGNSNSNRYKNPTIQYVTTTNFENIPTLYRSVSPKITVDAKVFIVTLANGQRYVLENL